MYISENHPLPKNIFESLANTHDMHCVSIYMPMHKTGKEQNERLAQANLKHCIKEVYNTLINYQLSDNDIKNYLKPIEDLIAKVELWRNPSDGLAIFLDKKGLSYYTLPLQFETLTTVADHFYLKPLFPLYHDNGIYYVLELSQDYIKLFEGSKYSFEDVSIEDFAPDKLEKAVGFDFKPKMLQFRSGHATHGAGSFHGHGEGKDEEKKELYTYFRAIDKGVNKVIKTHNHPLVLSCAEPLYDIYKEASSYPNLYEKYLEGDSEFKNKTVLHKESWNLIQPYFEKTKELKKEKFTELYSTPKISYQISDIIPAAFNGKIDTLFVQKNADLFGTYNKDTERLVLEKKKEINNASLTNITSLQTFLQGGKVYVLDEEQMPIKGHPINALFRY